MAKSSESDDEKNNHGVDSDFDDGASLNSTNLDKNFRGAMKNMTYGIMLPGKNMIKNQSKNEIKKKLSKLPMSMKVKNGGEGLV